MSATKQAQKTVEYLEPLGDRIVVRRDEAAAQSEGGIIIPEQAKERPKRGTVVSIGNGRIDSTGILVPMTCGVGDVVMFSNYAGTEIEFGEEKLLIMREEDVLGIVRKVRG